MNENDAKLDEVLAGFEGRNEPFDEMDIADAIQGLLRVRGGKTAEPTFRELAEGIAFSLAETGSEEKSRWGTYYGPKNIWKMQDGAEREAPSIDRITADMLDHWKSRADATQQPRLKARYADLVWDLSHRVIQSRPEVRFAQMAVDATVQLITGGQCEYSCDAHCKLKRALAIALSINDVTRVEAVRDAAIAYERETATDDALGTWGFAYDLLIEGQRKPVLTTDQERLIIDDLEARLTRAANSEPPHFDPFGAESAALRLARHYRRTNRPDDLRRVMNTYVQAWIKISQQAMPLLGATWLEKVHRTLLDFGLRAEADAMEPKLRSIGARSHENMAKISHSVSFTANEIEAFANEMTAGTLTDTFTRIAVQFLPDPVKAREHVLKIAEQSPTMSLFSRRVIDHDGRVIAEVGSVRDDLDGHVVQHIAQDLTFWRPFLRLALERAQSKHNATLENYIEFLYQSPAFLSETQPLIERGMRAFTERDFAVAIHLLIPQVEAAVRNLVVAAGGPVYEVGRHGGTNLRNLDKLLTDSRLVASLTERIALYLRVLLTDQRGWNVRNLVCHGLVSPNAFGPPVADRIVHSLLLLALVRETPANPADEGDPVRAGG
ncbi:MAG: DUF4209 domain-containing protein [Phycisphaerales bacterium]|nr:DUF4209 domain-containing protein [Phycisphaerales bacterium]